MANTLVLLLVHVVFSTKNREPLLSADTQPRLWQFMGGIARTNGADVLAAGGTDNHIHLLLRLPATLNLADALRVIKAASSRWLREAGLVKGKFSWQSGYGALSVSPSQSGQVIDYILNQTDHHRTRTYEEEFRAMLERSGIEFDEHYWLG